MDAPPAELSRLDALGQRLRTARRGLGLSQEALAQPEFTKSYISAVERGKVRPSLKALDLLSRRLGVPLSDLLAAVPPPADAPNVPAMEADLRFQLSRASMLTSTNQADEAIRVINSAAQQYNGYLSEMEAQTRFSIHYLLAAAHLRLKELVPARAELNQALEIAPQADGDGAAVAAARNLLGSILFQQDVPHLALEQHRLALAAADDGNVADLNLRLQIHKNLAADYAALGDNAQAAAIYSAGLGVLGASSSLDNQANLYWSLSLDQHSAGDVAGAQVYATRALDIAEAKENMLATAQMNIALAAIQSQNKDFDSAQASLERARATLSGAGDPLGLSALYESLAGLELQRDNAQGAADYARQSIDLSAGIAADQTAGDALTQAALRRTSARALRIAGVAEHRLGNYAESDALFQRSLSMVNEGEYDETAMEIELAYADLLAERGEHEQASSRYKAAFSYRNRRGR